MILLIIKVVHAVKIVMSNTERQQESPNETSPEFS